MSITGERLCGGGEKIVSVTLCGLAATITSDNCNLVQVLAGDLGAKIKGDVVLTSDTGAIVSKADAFEYVGEGNITSVSPAAGQAGSLVTIQGESLFGGGAKAVSVTLAGVTAQIIGSATNDTYLVVKANAGPLSLDKRVGSVVITSDTRVDITKLNAWSYSVIEAVEPAAGQGGTVVTISGASLTADGEDVTKVDSGRRCRPRIVEL